MRAVEQLHQPADLLVRLLPCFGLRVELGLDPRQLLRVRRLQRLELLPVRLLCRREVLGAFLALSGQRRFELRLLLLEPGNVALGLVQDEPQLRCVLGQGVGGAVELVPLLLRDRELLREVLELGGEDARRIL